MERELGEVPDFPETQLCSGNDSGAHLGQLSAGLAEIM